MGYPIITPPYYSTFTTITPPSSNPYTPFASFPNPYDYYGKPESTRPYSQFQPPPPSSPPLPYSQPQPPPPYSGYYNNYLPYSQPTGAYEHSGAPYSFFNSVTPTASQPNREELLVAMQESIREIKDSLLALRDAIRKEERLSTSESLNDTFTVPDKTHITLCNELPQDITHNDSPADAEFQETMIASEAVAKSQDVLSLPDEEPGSDFTMRKEKSDNPKPPPPPPPPPPNLLEANTFAGRYESLTSAELWLTHRPAMNSPRKPPDTNPPIRVTNPPPPLPPPKPPDYQQADSTRPPPPSESIPLNGLSSQQSPSSFTGVAFTRTKCHQNNNVKTQPSDTHIFSADKSQPLRSSTIRVTCLQPIDVHHVSSFVWLPPLHTRAIDVATIHTQSTHHSDASHVFRFNFHAPTHVHPENALQAPAASQAKSQPHDMLPPPNFRSPPQDKSTIHVKHSQPISGRVASNSFSGLQLFTMNEPSALHAFSQARPFNGSVSHALSQKLRLLTLALLFNSPAFFPSHLMLQLTNAFLIHTYSFHVGIVSNVSIRIGKNDANKWSINGSINEPRSPFSNCNAAIAFNVGPPIWHTPPNLQPNPSILQTNGLIIIDIGMTDLGPQRLLPQQPKIWKAGHIFVTSAEFVQKEPQKCLLVFSLGIGKAQPWDPGGYLHLSKAAGGSTFKQWGPGKFVLWANFYNLEDKVGLDG